MLQEKHLQSQAEIAAVHSQLTELQARTHSDIQRVQEKSVQAEQEALEHLRVEMLEAGALRSSLSEAEARLGAAEHSSENLKKEHSTLKQRLFTLKEDANANQTKLQAELNAQMESTGEKYTRLQEELGEQTKEAHTLQGKLSQAERRFD